MRVECKLRDGADGLDFEHAVSFDEVPLVGDLVRGNERIWQVHYRIWEHGRATLVVKEMHGE